FCPLLGEQRHDNGLSHLRHFLSLFYGATERNPGAEPQEDDPVAGCSWSSLVRNSVFPLIFRASIYQSKDESANCLARRTDVISFAAVWRLDVRVDSQLDQALCRSAAG